MRTIPSDDHRNFNAPSTWIPCFAITIGSTTYYYTPNPEAVTVDGHTYTPFPVTLNDIREDGKGEISTVELTVANIGGTLSAAVRDAAVIDGYPVVFTVCALRGPEPGDITGQGVPSASSYSSALSHPSKAIDDNASTLWAAGWSGAPQWWRIDFGASHPRAVTTLRVKPCTIDNGLPNAFVFQGSQDGSAWTDLYTGNFAANTNWQEFTIVNMTPYRYYRIYISSLYGPGLCEIYEIEMLDGVRGRAVVGAGDISAQSTPSASSRFSSAYAAIKAIDDSEATHWAAAFGAALPQWLQWDFGASAPRSIIRLRAKPAGYDGARPNAFTFAGSQDASSWTTLLSSAFADSTAWQEFTVANTTAYRYYRLTVTSCYGAGLCEFSEIELMDATPVAVYTETLEIIECGGITEQSITFKLGTFNPYLIRMALARFQKDYCSNTYKGAGCWIRKADGTYLSPSGFTVGSPDTCAKSLAECRRHTNTARFRGFPGIPGVTFAGV